MTAVNCAETAFAPHCAMLEPPMPAAPAKQA
jgi:hypothetical protein